jgi:NH3-dependent NAD+ synthetase
MQTEKVIDYIVNWLKDYATKAGVKGFVIGVSGGVDSGVVSTLRKDRTRSFASRNANSSETRPSKQSSRAYQRP